VIPKVITDGVKLKANGVPWPVSRLELVIAASLFRQEILSPSQRYQLLVSLAFGVRFPQASTRFL